MKDNGHTYLFCAIFSPIGPLGGFGLVVAMSIRLLSPFNAIFQAPHWPLDYGRINQAAARWQDQPGRSPLAGSTRQQTVGRVNQVADRGDGDDDEDKDEDEIPSYAVLTEVQLLQILILRKTCRVILVAKHPIFYIASLYTLINNY